MVHSHTHTLNYSLIAQALKSLTGSTRFTAPFQTHTNRHCDTKRRAQSTSASQAYFHPSPPPPSQVQEDKQRADRISLQRIKPDSEHPFSLFLLRPVSLSQFYFISFLRLNVIVCLMSSCFSSQCFSETHKYSYTHSSLRHDGALTIRPKKGQLAKQAMKK